MFAQLLVHVYIFVLSYVEQFVNFLAVAFVVGCVIATFILASYLTSGPRVASLTLYGMQVSRKNVL